MEAEESVLLPKLVYIVMHELLHFAQQQNNLLFEKILFIAPQKQMSYNRYIEGGVSKLSLLRKVFSLKIQSCVLLLNEMKIQNLLQYSTR